MLCFPLVHILQDLMPCAGLFSDDRFEYLFATDQFRETFWGGGGGGGV
jgi:hypothetical protein